MNVEGPQIYHMNKAKNDCLAKENQFFARKNNLKIAYFGVRESGLPDFGSPGRQTVDTTSTSGLPLKILGYDGSN